jgi:hypothetical protein
MVWQYGTQRTGLCDVGEFENRPPEQKPSKVQMFIENTKAK